MAASTALPPSRSTCAPASDASRCGVAITPLVTKELSRGDELDRAGLDLEQRGQKARVLAVEVDTHPILAADRDAFAVHQLVVRVVLVQVSAPADGADAADRLQLPGVADEDDVEDAVGRRSRRCYTHAASEVLAVGDHDLHCLEVVGDAVDHNVHRLVLPCHQGKEGGQLEGRRAQPLAAVVDPMHNLAAETCVGDVYEVAYSGAAIRSAVRHAARIEPPRHASPKDFDRRFR